MLVVLALSYHFPAQRSPLRPTVAVRSSPPRCAASAEALEAARELLRQEALRLEEEERAAQQSAVDAAWERLAARLPSAAPDTAAPVLTLYRDTNGWCPFCEKVWLQLMAKGVPFETELVNLQDKPAWYKEMVPTTLVPVQLSSAEAEGTGSFPSTLALFVSSASAPSTSPLQSLSTPSQTSTASGFTSGSVSSQSVPSVT